MYIISREIRVEKAVRSYSHGLAHLAPSTTALNLKRTERSPKRHRTAMEHKNTDEGRTIIYNKVYAKAGR
jgi:hypothetical protein